MGGGYAYCTTSLASDSASALGAPDRRIRLRGGAM